MRSKVSVCILLIICLSFSFLSCFSATPQEYNKATPEKLQTGHLYGAGCILINADTGDVLYEKNPDGKMYPASTTKIMTCILALEYGPELQEDVVIPNGITVDSSSSKMGLFVGDTMKFEDLLYGMMLASGNDAAKAVAILVSGSEFQFVQLMNTKLAELGISVNTTHFDNVHGLHGSNHYTTARDLATIMAYALKDPTFRDIIACREHTVYSTFWPDGQKFTSKYDIIDPDSNLYYEYCIGGKTGYTSRAGRCFVGAAEKDGIRLIAVSMNPSKIDENDKTYTEAFTDNIRLFKYGFLQYSVLSFKQLEDLVPGAFVYPVQNAAENDPESGMLEIRFSNGTGDYTESYLNSQLQEDAFAEIVFQDFRNRISVTFDPAFCDDLNRLKAPFTENQVIGKATFTGKDGVLYTCDVVASRNVPEKKLSVPDKFDNAVKNSKLLSFLAPAYNPPIILIYILLVVVIIVLCLSRNSKRRKLNRQRKARFEQKKKEYLRRMQQEERVRRTSGSGSRSRKPHSDNRS